MSFFGRFTKKGKLKNKEAIADRQYLDALEIIKESTETWLDLLVLAKEDIKTDGKNGGAALTEDMDRLMAKLNNTASMTIKNWNGELKIEFVIKAEAYLNELTKKRLVVE